jgi:polysaccharide deacetylase family protein (PEP-CTERM system associated)
MKILTFDIEDWFHILDNEETKSSNSWDRFPSRVEKNVNTILDLLDDNNQKATFFILGWIALKFPNLIREIAQRGHHIGCHSYAHQLVYSQSQKEFREDLKKAKELIESVTCKSIDSYRAPGFSINSKSLWAFEILFDLGFRIDSSIFPANRAHGGISSFPYAEPVLGKIGSDIMKLFPLNSKKAFGHSFIYSGGGYFRLFPSFLIQSWFKNDDYVMTYFHPRDFDPNQPIVPGLNYLRYFKSYVGLKGALPKLDNLLQINHFVTLEEANKSVDWSAAKILSLSERVTG